MPSNDVNIMRDWIHKWAGYLPHKTVINEVETERAITYSELDRVGRRIATWLHEKGIGKGDRVAILAENSLEHFMLFAAALKSEIIMVPLNFRLAPRELDFMLGDCTPAMLITEAKYKAAAQQTQAYSQIPHHASLTELTKFYDERDETPQAFPQAALEDDDPIFIIYTAGTTGFPKGALYTHGMMFWNALNTALRLNLTEHDHTAVFLPLFHTGGLNVFATPFMYFGASFALMKGFNADLILQICERQKMTVMMGVPTTLKMIAASPHFQSADLSSVRYAIVGGEPMPVPLIEQWHTRGIAIRQGFGMTEVGPNLFSLHQHDATRKIGSIGLPNFYVETRVVVEDEIGNELDAAPEADGSRSGELLLRGPMATPGYWNNTNASADAWRGGWFHTGDVVRVDAEGYFFVIDRKKHMYISGGENVYPAEVEKFLVQHPKVADAAIVGVPDAKWGEVGVAYIVPKADEILSEEDILAYCNGKLAKYKMPKYVRLLVELPKNDAGKINRRTLQALFDESSGK
jgi:fatty-acyl-CoA synthase